MEIVNIWDCFKLLNVLFRHYRAQSRGIKFGIFWKLFMCLNSKIIILITTYFLTQLKPTAMTYTQNYEVFFVAGLFWCWKRWLSYSFKFRSVVKHSKPTKANENIYTMYHPPSTTHHLPPTTMNVFCGPFCGKHQSQIHGDLTWHYDTNAYMYVEASKAIALCLTKARMCHSWLQGRWRWTPHCRALSGH